MPSKAIITTPFPSLEETAKAVGLSPKRARKVAELMDAIIQRRSRIVRRGRMAARSVASKRSARARSH